MGEIVNYMQLDTSRIEQVISTIHVCWDGPLQVLVKITDHTFIVVAQAVFSVVHFVEHGCPSIILHPMVINLHY